MLISLFGLFTFLTWNYFGLLIIVCVSLFLKILKEIELERKCVFYCAFYLIFLSYNIFSTFWLYTVDHGYSILTYFVNALLQWLIFIFLFNLSKLFKSYLFFLLWPIFEVLLTQWDIAWPWLILGNSLANCWYLIQWYSIVGVYGGTMWILLYSWCLYCVILYGKHQRYLFVLTIPCIFSVVSNIDVLKSNQSKEYEYQKILVYNHKGQQGALSNFKDLFLDLDKINDPNLIVVTPELFYKVNKSEISGQLNAFIEYYFERHPTNTLLVGVELIQDRYRFNSLVLLRNKNHYFRIKKKYVPVTEYTTRVLTPFFGKSYFSKSQADDLPEIRAYTRTTPFVCYEILFSDFVARNLFDSDYILLLSSEEFMNDSKYGKKQYDNLVRLRAIENGKYLLKNSYDGSSLLYAPNGEIVTFIEGKSNFLYVPRMPDNTIYQKIIYSLKIIF